MSQMIEVKTAELSGAALRWAVAQAEGLEVTIHPPAYGNGHRLAVNSRTEAYRPDMDWSQGGPLIEKYGVLLSPPKSMMHVCGGPNAGWQETGQWGSTIFGRERKHRRACFDHKSNPLVAAMLAIVQFEFGDTVAVPAELLP